ncbi:hypothetical protein DPMN_156851 [Dreissena polymorpha]|uniref:Uncharacterized protein n=1 Tax=Dreissena polymorpha TaxID=45954 RepID=A0A9D4J954_DREPO|nr:hypothetical protein DPMN_156851 [Dreissena polymorpha]
MLISGIGPKLARVIVQLRQGSGNLDLDTLEVLIGRPLVEKKLDQLYFAENPMLAAASQASGTEEEHPSRSRAPEPMFVSTPYLNQDQMKAVLASQISDLEADITRWEEFPGIWSDFLPQFAKPLFPKGLLFQPDPLVVTGMPIPSDVASSVPAPPQSLGLPQMRAGRQSSDLDEVAFVARLLQRPPQWPLQRIAPGARQITMCKHNLERRPQNIWDTFGPQEALLLL